MMVWMLSCILLIYILQAVATYIRIRWGHYLGVRMENQMRKELFSHLQTLSFSYFDKTKTGTIMSRITALVTKPLPVSIHFTAFSKKRFI